MVMTLWIYVNINTPSAVDLRHQSEEKVQPPRMLQYWIIPKPGYYFELYATWVLCFLKYAYHPGTPDHGLWVLRAPEDGHTRAAPTRP